MSDRLYRRRVDKSFYVEDMVCDSLSVIGEVLTWGYESESPNYFVCEDDLPKFCEEVFKEMLNKKAGWDDDWRATVEELANIIQFAKEDYGIEIY